MSNNKKNIAVLFNYYLPYDECPYTRIVLGTITPAQLNTMLDEVEKGASQPHPCLRTTDIQSRDFISLRPVAKFCERYGTLELTNMFYLYDAADPKTHAPCMAGRKQPQTEDAMVKTCAHNLRCGKCRDEFIRRTLGATLFPQFYAKDKQK